MQPITKSTRMAGVSNLAVLAPIRPGFVVGFESITYAKRLGTLLNALNASRMAARESDLNPSPFPETIGRFGIIQSFRYAIVEPGKLGAVELRDPTLASQQPGAYQLSLNVTFDGGWEPYMRVIYHDIGTLLDALFCNCVGYPGSRNSSFQAYCLWVRKHELTEGLFYTDSSMTLGDQHYLERIERMQREARDPAAADRAIAGFAAESAREQKHRAMQDALRDPRAAIASSLRSLKGLYRLSSYYPPNKENENEILVRFARDVLREFHKLFSEHRGALASVNDAFRDELDWFFDSKLPEAKASDRTLTATAANLQGGIVKPYPGITHGCVVMLRVKPERTQALAAAKTLAAVGNRTGHAIQRNVALTYPGLCALGIQDEHLERLPIEFVEGMEARAGILGDLRTNHPDNWTRPPRNWPPEAASGDAPIDLTTVHAVVVLRLVDPATQSADLHPRLRQAITDELAADKTGLSVLSVQPMRSHPEPGGKTREHFGFIDGLSQPQAPLRGATPPTKRDEVNLGEILLGHRNDREDPPYPETPDPLLDNGSFLVMRKLRQRVDVLNDVLDAQTRRIAPNTQAAQLLKVPLLERMMGRRMNGDPLVPAGPAGKNDFDYDADPQGVRCPFHSHVRRTNPRDGRKALPRILRRGMSYGSRCTNPTDIAQDRGVVFMAYCASIAEQFEVVQRWVAGGNSSGVSSSQADPFMAVPEAGDARTFRFAKEDGTVVRIDLGDQPFVSLQWGLYLFVPSLDALRQLPKLAVEKPRAARSGEERSPTLEPIDAWRNVLEDPARSESAWEQVRKQGGVFATPYGLLVGDAVNVRKVLQDDGTYFSVCGYGKRMQDSIGLGYLGLDVAGPHKGHDEQAEMPAAVNKAIESITEAAAFEATREAVAGVLAEFGHLAPPDRAGAAKVPVDLLSLGERVLARLCTAWFGLPDDAPPKDAAAALMVTGGRSLQGKVKPRCPGNLLTTSRYIFSSRPGIEVEAAAKPEGMAVLDAFKFLLQKQKEKETRKENGSLLGALGTSIRTELQRLPGVKRGGNDELVARTIAGVMMGFPPTVYGNFLRIATGWILTRELWDLQHQLDESRASRQGEFDRARAVLFDRLMKTMSEKPIPETIWRTAVNGAKVNGKAPSDDAADKMVILGLASAMKDGADHSLMFGGSRSDEKNKTVHACPGHGMAVGVLLGMFSGLLEAGELRPTGSTVQLTLMPRSKTPLGATSLPH
jgi:Dyp-type peroxidase family